MMTVGNDRLFVKLCIEALDDSTLAADSRFRTNADRVANASALNGLLNKRLAGDVRAVWVSRLRAAGVPAGSVRSPNEAVGSAEIRDTGMLAEMVHPNAGTIPVIASPIRLSSAPDPKVRPSPMLDEHTSAVLRELLGVTDAELTDLAASGAISRQAST
jgi:formyl-CoA transferase